MTTRKTQPGWETKSDRVSVWGDAAGLMGLGMQWALTWLLLIGGGWWLDGRRGGGIRLTLLGLCASLLIQGIELWRLNRGPMMSRKREEGP